MPSSTERSFLEVFKDAIVALGVDIAFKEWMKKWGDYGNQKFQNNVVDPEQGRAALLQDIMFLDQHGEARNLMRHYHDATTNLTENRFVALLCKIPQANRRDTLAWLNTLEDQEFDQALALLDHDVVMQWIERMREQGRRIANKDLQALKMACGFAWKNLDAAADSATQNLTSITARLKQRQTQRRAPATRRTP